MSVPDLRAAAEWLIGRAEDAATCPYGGHLSGCNHQPDVMQAAARLRLALAAPTPDSLDVETLSIAMNRAYTYGTGTAEQVAAEYERLRSTRP